MMNEEVRTGKGSLADRVLRRLAYYWRVAPVDVHVPGGLISFTFDDFPRSSATAGARILEEKGLRGTFYIAWGLSGVTNHQGVHFEAGDVRALAASGHEIGCHTFGHTDCAHTPIDKVRTDIDRNAAANANAGISAPMQSFAYPFGEIGISAKKYAAQRFKTARGVRIGINGKRTDLTSLLAAPIESRREDMIQTARDLIDATVKQGGWLIFYTHDICENPSDFGATPDLLKQIVDLAVESRAKVLPVLDASNLITPAKTGRAA